MKETIKLIKNIQRRRRDAKLSRRLQEVRDLLDARSHDILRNK